MGFPNYFHKGMCCNQSMESWTASYIDSRWTKGCGTAAACHSAFSWPLWLTGSSRGWGGKDNGVGRMLTRARAAMMQQHDCSDAKVASDDGADMIGRGREEHEKCEAL
jgi:hypothetical protein